MNAPDLDGMKLPPHNIEAEQSIIGGLMLDVDAFDKITELDEGDFYRDEHRKIYNVILYLMEERKPVDMLTVFAELQSRGESEHVGGLAYLGALANNTPSAANISRYAEVVHAKAQLRKLISVGDNISESAFAPGQTADDILDAAESDILAIRNAKRTDDFVTLQATAAKVIDRVQEYYDKGCPALTGKSTGLADLDKLTHGLQDTDMIIVAGRPGMGKTSLAMNIAEEVSVNQKIPVAVFSMEMPATQLTERLISSVSRIDSNRLKTGQLNDEEWARVAFALSKIQDAPMYIDETPGLNPMQLRSKARKLYRKTEGKLGLIVIDYVQLMTTVRGGDNRAAELSEISRSVKSLAKELHVPILLLSQLNRSLEQRPNKRPVMSDLRESGALEQDADIIMFVYRDEIYNPDSMDKGTAEIIIGKHRNGPTGIIHSAFVSECTRFADLAPGYVRQEQGTKHSRRREFAE